MKVPAIDEPIRLGAVFWMAYCLMAIPSLWLLKPWEWGPPIISQIAGSVLPPFLATIVLYCFAQFVLSLSTNLGGQKRAIAGLVAGIVGPSVFLVAAWIFSGYQNLPAICAFVASFIGYSLLYLMSQKRPNKSLEPTATAVTPRATEPKSK